MPVVTYGPRKVGTSAIPGVRKTAAETDLSTGVGLDQAKGASGIRQAESLGQLGQTIGQVGQFLDKEQLAIHQDEQRKADEVARLEYNNKLDAFTSAALYDPQTGALARKGKAAQSLPEEASAAFDKYTSELDATLNDRQRAAFGLKDRAAHWDNLQGPIVRHVFAEQQAHDVSEFQAFLGNSTNAAAANATDPRRVAIEVQDGLDAIDQFAGRQGLGAEAKQELVGKFTTGTHLGVIKSLIAQDRAAQAKTYYAAAKSQINGTQQDEIERQLDVAGAAQTGLKTAEALWQQHGPKSDLDPINLDTMETAAREQFKDDPKALDMTIKFLRERKAGVDASRQDRQEARVGAVWVAVSKGADLATVSKMPEFLASPGRLQEQVTATIVGRAEHDANRRYAEEGRAAAAESRAYTREQRAEATKTTKGWARYWDLSSPTVLSQTSENALQAMRGDLGDDHVNRLLTQKRAIGKSDDTIRAATIDDDLFKVTAQRANINAYSPKTDQEKSDLGQLKNAVETAIDQAQQQKGKLLTRDEKAAIMTSLTDQKVTLDHNWFFADPEKVAATVTNADDRKSAYVPIAKIPPLALGQYLNYARSLAPRLSDDELRSRFQDRLQRAYALRLLGGTRAEIEAALQGKE